MNRKLHSRCYVTVTVSIDNLPREEARADSSGLYRCELSLGLADQCVRLAARLEQVWCYSLPLSTPQQRRPTLNLPSSKIIERHQARNLHAYRTWYDCPGAESTVAGLYPGHRRLYNPQKVRNILGLDKDTHVFLLVETGIITPSSFVVCSRCVDGRRNCSGCYHPGLLDICPQYHSNPHCCHVEAHPSGVLDGQEPSVPVRGLDR